MDKQRLNKICDLAISFYKAIKKFTGEYTEFKEKKRFNFEAIDLLEVDLFHLKSKTHDVFRHSGDSEETTLERENLFDLVIGSIFHELLHVKEYAYTLQSYAPRYALFQQKKKLRRSETHENDFLKHSLEIIKEAKENLPRKASEVKHLFRDALFLMEGILKKYKTSRRLMRLLYLEKELFDSVYGENGLEYLYRKIYKGGAMEGYFRVGASFLRDGFYEFAIKSFKEALSKDTGSRLEKELRQEINKKCLLLSKKHLVDTRVQKLLVKAE